MPLEVPKQTRKLLWSEALCGLWAVSHPGDSSEHWERFPWDPGPCKWSYLCRALPGVVKPYPQISSLLSCLKSVSRSWGMTHKSSFEFLINSFLLSSLPFFAVFPWTISQISLLAGVFVDMANFKSVLHTICRKCILNVLLQVSSLSPLKNIPTRRMKLKTQAPVCTPKHLVAERRKPIASRTLPRPFLSIVLVARTAVLGQTTGPSTALYCLLQQSQEEIQGNVWTEQLLSQRQACRSINP